MAVSREQLLARHQALNVKLGNVAREVVAQAMKGSSAALDAGSHMGRNVGADTSRRAASVSQQALDLKRSLPTR